MLVRQSGMLPSMLRAAVEALPKATGGPDGKPAQCLPLRLRQHAEAVDVVWHVAVLQSVHCPSNLGSTSGFSVCVNQVWCLLFLQALSPSPFYFFDEVDCALDSLAAGQVAAYVKAQCKGGLTVTTAVTGTETGGNASTGAAGNKTSCNSAAGSDAPAVAAQYLLVSHRPAVFESASCLLGVYSNGRGSSATVVAHFPDLGASS
eukprot:GHUV01037195.1.p1 GENE.GHUV01037195.1~~GHUV01037195.1.p1  ORF type:complete len:204 (+),score=63.51 GHUV01037195.1:227-838(+)